MKYCVFISLLFLFFSSCTIQNNLYLSNPKPLGKGNLEAYGGISTGLRPKLDTVKTTGEVIVSKDFGWAPNLNFGTNIGLGEQVNLGIDLHLPYGFAGLGLQLRPQYSFFNQSSKFQLAVAGRAGFITPKDSIKADRIAGSIEELQTFTGGMNADFALSASFQIADETWLILTPRLSTNRLWYWETIGDSQESKHHNYNFTALSIGLRYRHIHVEVSAQQLGNHISPTFGVVYIGQVE